MDLDKEYRHEVYYNEDDDGYNSTSEEEFPSSREFNTRSRPTVKSTVKIEEESYFDICLGNREAKESAKADVKRNAKTAYNYVKNNLPGFFTPFDGKKEFGLAAAAPLGLPVALTLITAASAIAAAGAALTSLGSLFFAAGYGLYGLHKESSKEKAHDALMVAAKAGIVAAVATVAAVAAFVLAAVAFPVALTYLLTRSGATLVSKASECLSSCGSKEESHDESKYNIVM